MNDQTPMNYAEARDSFTGKTLTIGQLDEVWAIAAIMKRDVEKNGSFREKLTDYAHAFARTERFDALRGETIIRDIYRERYGETMNQTRTRLMEQDAQVKDLPEIRNEALTQARRIEPIIREGETKPFYRAYDTTAHTLARQFDITETTAKELMQTSFREAEGKELYDWGKALEKEHHLPARETARTRRKDRTEHAPDRSRA